MVLVLVALSSAASRFTFFALTVASPPALTVEPCSVKSLRASIVRSPPKLSFDPTCFKSVVWAVVVVLALNASPAAPVPVASAEAPAEALAEADDLVLPDAASDVDLVSVDRPDDALTCNTPVFLVVVVVSS